MNHKNKSRLLVVLGLIVLLIPSLAHGGWSESNPNQTDFPPAAFWEQHLTQDLIPFWLQGGGLSQLPFPSFMLDNGTPLDDENDLLYVDTATRRGGEWILKDIGKNYIRTHSRMTFALGVAFHLTGNVEYLDLMRAGVDWLLREGFDDEGAKSVAGVSGDARTSQDQAYALTGLAFYYYLTRDRAVLNRILAQHRYIMDTYGRYDAQGSLKGLAWLPEDEEVFDLTAVLDQLNAYMLLVIPFLPNSEAEHWKKNLNALCEVLLKHFAVPAIKEEGTQREIQSFWGSLKEKKLDGHHLDFGHSVKSWWMIHLSGKLLNQKEFIQKGLAGMKFLIEHGFVPGEMLMDAARERNFIYFPPALAQEATWGEKFLPKNKDDWWVEDGVSLGQHWWIHCEMDQAAATCAMIDPQYTARLTATSRFFVNHFVDCQTGEVWHAIDPVTLAPQYMKVHSWKNAYHSFEHALIMAITSSMLRKEPLTLHYAFSPEQPKFPKIQAYYYPCPVAGIEYGTTAPDGRLDVAVTFHPGP